VRAKADRQKTAFLRKKTHETKMADFIPQGVRGVFEKLVPRLSKMHTLLLPSHQRTFVKTTEHPWTKTILSRGGRRNLFNPDLMNKLIRIK